MEQENKELLLKDLSARLPYGVIVELDEKFGFNKGTHVLVKELLDLYCVEGIKPYLRPMVSMTQEERKEYRIECNKVLSMRYRVSNHYPVTDWLNERHFDYRGLIERGLAIEMTEK
jgi:hypothetical protein